MRRNAFLWMQGLTISPHNTHAAPSAATKGRNINMANLFPPSDEQFSTSLGNFITVANANLVTVGLTAADITALTSAHTDIDAKIAASQAAKDAAKASTSAKKTSRGSANSALRAAVKKVEATPGVPDAIITQLGMTVRDTNPTRIEPTVPLELTAVGSPFGFNTLKWNKNGNKSGTTFIIEARVGDAAPFAFVGQATLGSFKHTGQTPGVKVTYRVKATRGKLVSDWSLSATAYDQILDQAA